MLCPVGKPSGLSYQQIVIRCRTMPVRVKRPVGNHELPDNQAGQHQGNNSMTLARLASTSVDQSKRSTSTVTLLMPVRPPASSRYVITL